MNPSTFAIYQTFYNMNDPDQISHMDQEFLHYFNHNDSKQLYEYSFFRSMVNDALEIGLTHWGYLSWRWKQKITNSSAAEILAAVGNKYLDYDVITINPYPEFVTPYHNIWHQGHVCHPHVVELATNLLAMAGYDPDLVTTPMSKREFLYCHYMIGNKQFWLDYVEFLDRVIGQFDNLSPDLMEKLLSSAAYPGVAGYSTFDHKPFVIERLTSTFLTLRQDLKIHALR